MNLTKNKKWVKGESYQKRILLENLEEKINLIEDVIVKPRGIIPYHQHNFTKEIFYITNNSATMILNGKKFKVSPGDMIYVDKNENHSFENNSDFEFKMIVFKINFKLGDSFLTQRA
jgi:quercetin dioxygenase-like cupin family protein